MRPEFKEYLAAGWALVDIPAGRKGPIVRDWNVPGTRFHGVCGAGLLHAYSGTCAIDIDEYRVAANWLADHGIDLDALCTAPDAVQISSGRAGHAKLLYALELPLESKQAAPYTLDGKKHHALDFRCATKDGLSVQDVLPPTIHPQTGNPYCWQYGDELLGDWRRLPPLPDALYRLWVASLEGAPLTQAEPVEPHDSARIEEAKEFLRDHDPNSGLVDWLKVGAALHWELNDDPIAFTLWFDWSRKSPKFKDRADLETHWRTFKLDKTRAATFDPWRARQKPVAATDFPVVIADTGKDVRPTTTFGGMLESRLVFVSSQGAYYDMEHKEGSGYLTDYSVRHLFSPQAPAGSDGKRRDPIQLLQYSPTKRVVDAVGMHPGAGRFYTEDRTRFVNVYTPLATESLRPKPQELEVLQFLWSRITNRTFATWLEKFYAYAIQHPGTKIRCAPLLHTEQTGTGKNTLAHTLPALMFGHRWMRTMSQNVLHSDFNDTIGETWWLYLEELHVGQDKRERLAIANRIKPWITDAMLEVHPKGHKPYNIRNRIQITATSNFPDAAQIDNYDRRWAIGKLIEEKLTDAQTLETFAFLNGERAAGVLRYHFQHVDTTGFNPNGTPPDTAERRSMIAVNLGTWETRIAESIAHAEPPFDRDIFTVRAVQEAMFGPAALGARRLGIILRSAPIYAQPLRHTGGPRYWAWRNIDKWDIAPQELRTNHVATGAYPAGEWTMDIPEDILIAAGDLDPE